jgi:hypothetical protein
MPGPVRVHPRALGTQRPWNAGPVIVLLFVGALLCAVVAVRPRATWRALTGWQFADPDRAELTGAMYAFRSAAAGLGALVLAGAGIWLLITGDERDCERILSELADASSGVDFDRSDLSEVGDDLEAQMDLGAVAAGLDVELEWHRGSVDVVAENGDRLGSIGRDGVVSRCG